MYELNIDILSDFVKFWSSLRRILVIFLSNFIKFCTILWNFVQFWSNIGKFSSNFVKLCEFLSNVGQILVKFCQFCWKAKIFSESPLLSVSYVHHSSLYHMDVDGEIWWCSAQLFRWVCHLERTMYSSFVHYEIMKLLKRCSLETAFGERQKVWTWCREWWGLW